jgi:Na+-driven multidrug efflux pump
MLSNFCFVLFTIIDAIFVGRGVGTNALGAINLVNPFVLLVMGNAHKEVLPIGSATA